MKGALKQLGSLTVLAAIGASLFGLPVKAEETVADQVNLLNDEIAAREARLEQLNSKLEQYTDAIRQKEAQAQSLSTEMEILDNKIAKLKLDLESTGLEIENVDSEVRLLDIEINEETKDMERQKAMLASILREMENNDDVSAIELVFGNQNFAELFDSLSQLESVHQDLGQILAETQQTRNQMESKKAMKENKLASLQDLELQMKSQKENLEDSISGKEVILTETQSSEAQYRALVYELRQEQSFIDSQLLTLQRQIEQRIADSDEFGDVSLLTWPVENFRMTTRFHDPTYPFRNLFEHSGLDLAIPQGSAVRSAAPGYVAFAKTGRMYGNYVMIIHGNGMATLYAHLSKINVQADQFVGRGDVIALSGGLPGTPGAGFSTGPHLHFEVRSDGIPVDPMGFMVGL